jgi:tryptophan synthase
MTRLLGRNAIILPIYRKAGHLHVVERLSKNLGGATIWLKREDLNHTGSHRINSAGQILRARRLGKTEIIAQSGAGMHGVASATICAKFNTKCTVFMGALSPQALEQCCKFISNNSKEDVRR